MTSTSPPSRRARMYLPRRSIPVTRLPTSRFANCFRLWCRRIERIPSASTALTRLPTISRSRSRRTTSTSGNSGIVVLRSGLVRPARRRPRSVGRLGVGDLAQVPPRDARRRLLRVLLRPALTGAPRLTAQQHGGEEVLRVVGPFVAHLITGELVEGLGGQLLQAGLVVVTSGARRALDDPRLEQAQHELAGGVPPAVEVHGGDDGFHGVGEDGRLVAAARRLLPLAEPERRAQPDLPGDLGEHLTVDDRGAQLRQLALGHVGVLPEHVVGDDEAEDGVAQELESLVRHRVRVLGAVRAVRQRPVDQPRVTELEPQRGVEISGPSVLLPSPPSRAHRYSPSRATT